MKEKNHVRPELIAPAGNWGSLVSAISAGADGVYFGVKGLNMREGADNFDLLEIKKIMSRLREEGKKGYLTLNTVMFDKDIELIKKILKESAKSKVDAVILWDMAVLALARKIGVKAHLSTQASVANTEALKFYASLGVERVVLARECALSDIKRIIDKAKKEKIKCQIETFVHGAMCVSISGRCFMSQLSFNKSANRGECLQPCRRKFRIVDSENDSEYVVGEDFVLSPKDLCTIEIIDKLIETGISAFKIEGRARSPEYVSIVTSAYRKAIDAFYEGVLTPELKEKLKEKMKSVYNRGFSTGFYLSRPGGGEYTKDVHNEYDKIYLGEVTNFFKKIGVAEIFVRNEGVKTGDEIFVSGKSTPVTFSTVTELEKDHKKVKQAMKGEKVAVKLAFAARLGDKVFLWRPKRGN